MLGAVGVIAIVWDTQQSLKEPNWLLYLWNQFNFCDK